MQYAEDELAIQSEELAFLDPTVAEAASGVTRALHLLNAGITEPAEHTTNNNQTTLRLTTMSATSRQLENSVEAKSVTRAIFRTELLALTDAKSQTWGILEWWSSSRGCYPILGLQGKVCL